MRDPDCHMLPAEPLPRRRSSPVGFHSVRLPRLARARWGPGVLGSPQDGEDVSTPVPAKTRDAAWSSLGCELL